jgi:hypothetical protein
MERNIGQVVPMQKTADGRKVEEVIKGNGN